MLAVKHCFYARQDKQDAAPVNLLTAVNLTRKLLAGLWMFFSSTDYGLFHDATALFYIVVTAGVMLAEANLAPRQYKTSMRLSAAAMVSALGTFFYTYYQHKFLAVPGGALFISFISN